VARRCDDAAEASRNAVVLKQNTGMPVSDQRILVPPFRVPMEKSVTASRPSDSLEKDYGRLP
jgi:hypothetical protein